MKSAVLALFLGSSAAIKLSDAPPYFNEPTWNEEHQSAAGFIQISACVNANAQGVTCRPANSELFATGMNGDEDLGEDITMKGEKFHYSQKKDASLVQFTGDAEDDVASVLNARANAGHHSAAQTMDVCNGANGIPGQDCMNVQLAAQWNPVVVASTGPLPECHGNNGPDGVNCTRAACTGTNGPKDGPNGTPCTQEEPASIPHYNTDATAGRPYSTTGDLSATHPSVQSGMTSGATGGHPTSLAQISPDMSAEAGGAEKVMVPQTVLGATHTTFY